MIVDSISAIGVPDSECANVEFNDDGRKGKKDELAFTILCWTRQLEENEIWKHYWGASKEERIALQHLLYKMTRPEGTSSSRRDEKALLCVTFYVRVGWHIAKPFIYLVRSPLPLHLFRETLTFSKPSLFMKVKQGETHTEREWGRVYILHLFPFQLQLLVLVLSR